jgi:hypothetical protein
LSDVDHLEHHLGAQRERLRDAAVSLQDLIERVPGGLGEMRRPLLSASAESLLSTSRSTEGSVATSSPFDENDHDDGDDDDDDDDSAGPPDNATPTSSDVADDPSGPKPYEFHPLGDATPAHMAGTNPDADETLMMRLDLGELDVESATTPSWSAAGDDPLIVGDELQ